MTPELQKYYEARFSMTGSQGWKDLMADISGMLASTDTLSGVNDEKSLHYKKGEISIMRWLLSLDEMSEISYKELNENDA